MTRMMRKNAVRIDKITVRFWKKTSQKKNSKTSKKKVKSVKIFKERNWEIEKCYIIKENFAELL